MSNFQSSTSKELSATFDRGPAKYFHGRENVFDRFDELTEKFGKVNGCSTFMIQGAQELRKLHSFTSVGSGQKRIDSISQESNLNTHGNI